MPRISPTLRRTTPLTDQDKRTLLIAIKEMESRGIPVADNIKHPAMLTSEWSVDPYGYFLKLDGKRYTPTDNQEAFINSLARMCGFFGSRGSGKTSAGAQKALKKIKQGQSGAVLNPDFENFKYSTWPELREWIPWDMVIPKHRYRQSEGFEPHQPFTMVFYNGARMICKGLKDPDSARGPNINWLWYDEAGRDKTGMGWKLAVAGVRIGKDPQAWVTTTPKGLSHWLYKFFIEKAIPDEAIVALREAMGADREMVESFFGTLEQNKNNVDAGTYAQLLATYSTGWLRLQELEGQFVDEGTALGSRAWFLGKGVAMAPDYGKRVRYWDLAASERKISGKKKTDDPDSTVGTKLCAADGRFYIENQISAQIAWADIKRLIVDTARMDGPNVPIVIEQEPGSGGKNQVAEFMGMPELSAYMVRGHSPRQLGDKVMRALPWFGRAQSGLVYYVMDAWNEPFLQQVDGFPLEAHDDRVDSVSGCFAILDPAIGWKKVPFLAV